MSERTSGTAVASGKIILLGEHAVVYGRPAIAAGLPNGARATAEYAETTALHVAPWNLEVEPGDEPPVAKAFAALLAAMDVRRGVRVAATVEIPGGSGLGSSAALGVAVMRAIDDLFARARDEVSALEVSLAWERVFHGNPSGVDNAMAYAGGLATFVRGQPLERLRAKRALPLVVGDSGMACSTKITVADVARQHAGDRARMEGSFDAIGSIVRNGKLAIEAGDLRALGQLFDMNQSLLAAMLVSTGTLEEMIAVARGAGALGAKLTGGGGGGCMIALAEDDAAAERIKDAIVASGKHAFVAMIGGASA